MLELSKQFHPEKLSEMLRKTIFSYANVPYRIKSFDALVEDAKSTVTYDEELSLSIEKRVEKMALLNYCVIYLGILLMKQLNT